MRQHNGHDKDAAATWENRWQGAGEKGEAGERLTWLGRRMLRAKKERLQTLARQLGVRTVVEVGCGLGYTLAAYADAGLDCLGIDVSENAVQACRKKGLPARRQSLEETTDQFDLVSSDGMLEHFLHFAPLAAHMVRISKKYILLIQPNHESFFGKTLVYLAELLRGRINVHEYNYRIDDFIQVFSMVDCQIVRNEPVFWDVFRLLLFMKNDNRADTSV